MKKNIGSHLVLYPMPVTVIGAMNGDKPNVINLNNCVCQYENAEIDN